MLRRLVGDLEARLAGWPDATLGAALVIVAAALVFVALSRSSVLKAGVLAWVLLP